MADRKAHSVQTEYRATRKIKVGLLLSSCATLAAPGMLAAQDVTVPSGTTLTTQQTARNSDTITVEEGGAIVTASGQAINVNCNPVNPCADVTIDNSGTIDGAQRGINHFYNTDATDFARNITILNRETGTITGSLEAIRLQGGGNMAPATGSTILIDNAGSIVGGDPSEQAIEVINIPGAELVLVNQATGSIVGAIGIETNLDNVNITNLGEITGTGGTTNGEALRIRGEGTNLVYLGATSSTNASAVDGNAINFLGGATSVNTVTIEAGASVFGKINGSSDGQDTMILRGTGSGAIAANANFDVLSIESGEWTLDSTFASNGGEALDSATIDAGATLILVDSPSGSGGGLVRSDIVNNGTLDFARSGFVSQTSNGVTGAISGTGDLIINGGGALLATAANTYSGDTIITNGQLRAEGDNTFSANSAVVVGAAGILNLSNNTADFNQTIASLSGEGAVRLGVLSADNTLTLGGDNQDTTFSGTIEQTGNVTKVGSGTLTLAGDNSFIGAFTIAGGGLALSGAGDIAEADSLVLASGATFDISGADSGRTVQNLSAASGSAVTLGANTLTVSNDTDTTVAANISGPGGLTTTGTGTLSLAAANTYTGDTTINGNTLALIADGSVASSGNLIMSADGSVFDISGITAAGTTVNRLQSSTFLAEVLLGDKTLTIVNADTVNGVSYRGTISGTGSIVKDGTGTLNLFSANSYNGGTTILAGTLRSQAVDAFGTGVLDIATDGTANLAGFVTHVAGVTGSGRVLTGAETGGLFLTGAGNYVYNGTIQGLAGLVMEGSGTQTLTQANSYSGATSVTGSGMLALSGAGDLTSTPSLSLTGAGATFDISAADGDRSFDNVTAISGTSIVLGANSLTVVNDSDAEIGSAIAGTGDFIKEGTGLLTLSGDSGLTGTLNLFAGNLLLTGSVAGNAYADAGTTFIGAGTIGGMLSLEDGATLEIGNGGVGLLTTGGLALNANSILNYDLGTPGDVNASDRIQVNGDLVLDGQLRASDAGGFGAGVYRLMDYTGTLTDNGLSISALPAGFFSQQGTIQANSGQVNIVISSSLPDIQFWDGGGTPDNGVIEGGSGSWVNSDTSWTNIDGTNNGDWLDKFAVFNGTAGTVTVDEAITFTGMQFMVDGYVIAAGAGALNTDTAQSSLRVDPGVTATVSADIGGTGGLFKQDSGTLVLAGNNTYAGATTVGGGTLQATGGNAIGDASAVSVSPGAILTILDAETVGSIAGTGSVVLNGRLSAGGNDSSTEFGGTISGTSGLTKQGSGTLTLSGTNTQAGQTIVEEGVLLLASTGALANNNAVQIDAAGTLAISVDKLVGAITGDGSIDLGSNRLSVNAGDFGGVIAGDNTSSFVKRGIETLALSGISTMTGQIIVNGGTLAIAGNGSIASASTLNLSGADTVFDISAALNDQMVNSLQGSDSSTILLGANTLIANNNLDTNSSYNGTIEGTGGLVKTGAGTLNLGSTNSYSGGTTVEGGVLRAQAVDTFGSGLLTVLNGATANLAGFLTTVDALAGGGLVQLGADTGGLILTGAQDATFSGVIGGAAGLTKQGGSVQTLSGVNTYNGDTVIEGGTLALSGDGSIDNSASVTLAGASSIFDISGANGDRSVNELSGVSGSQIVLGANGLTATNATNREFAGVISGTGDFTIDGAGTLTLSAQNTATGTTTLAEGGLILTGALGGDAVLADGTSLTGDGTIAGTLSVGAATVAPGDSGIGTLTVGGLVLASDSTLVYDLGAPDTPGSSDRIQVNGDLTLDGSFVGQDAGGFGSGVYRIMDYTGTLTDNGLDVTSLPDGFLASRSQIQTSMAGQVNLIIAEAIPDIQFWDGSEVTGDGVIDGGPGSWNFSTTNWTSADGTQNDPWNSRFAVFAGAPGTVTVDDAISFTGIQFMTDGFVIADGTGALTISNAETNFRVDPGVTAEIAESIGGTSGLLKNDTGTLILSGTNTYNGATRIAFGTLRVEGGSAIANSSDVTVDGGATFDVAATEQVGSIAGAGTILLSGGNLNTNGNGASTTFTGDIVGTGGLTKSGAGTLTLTGDNTYTGTTRVSAGTLLGNIGTGGLHVLLGATFDQAGVSNTVGTLQGEGSILLGGADLSAGAGSDSTFAGVISGGGDFTKTGDGNLTLSGNNTFDGLTTIAAGTLTLAGTQTLASDADVVVTEGAALALATDNSFGTLEGGGSVDLGTSTLTIDDGVFAGIISGSGDLATTGAGNLTLSGANTFTGETLIGGGTFTLKDGGSIATSAGLALTGNAVFDMSAAGDQTLLGLAGDGGTSVLLGMNELTVDMADGTGNFAGVISGDGSLVKDGAGTLVLGAANSYTGGTDIVQGLLRVGAEGALGTGSVLVAGDGRLDLAGFDQTIPSLTGAGIVELGTATLTLGDASDFTFDGIIRGSGGLTKIGSGELTLTGNSDYSGATLVSAGGLVVEGRLQSDVTVEADAYLAGTGRIVGLSVFGTVAPRGTYGTLNVDGDVLFASGSTFEVGIGPDGSSDRILAGGDVVIEGGTVNVLADGTNYANLTDYTILTGASVSGEFDGLTDNLAFLDMSLGYDAGAVYLQALRNDISFASVGATPNQIAVGGAFDAAGFTDELGIEVVNMSAAQAGRSFDLLSGEIHAALLAKTVYNASADRRPILERMHQAEGEGPGLWLDASLSDFDADANDGYNAFGGTRVSLSGGLDVGFKGARIGAGVTHGYDDLDMEALRSTGNLTATTLFGYGRFGLGPLSAKVGAGYSWLDTETRRDLTVGSITDRLNGEEKGTQWQAFGELAYALTDGPIVLEPFVGVAHVTTDMDGTTETGGLTALRLGSDRTKATVGTLGLRADGQLFDFGRTPLRLDAEVAVDKYFDTDRATRTATLLANDGRFRVGATEFGDTTVRVRFGGAFDALGGEFGAGFVGAFSSEAKDYGVRLRAQWDF